MAIFKLPKWAIPVASSKWNTAVVWLVRIVVGCVFVFSGFVKGIDPWGGYYKLVEYFNAFGFPGLVQVALACAVALAAFEFVLGVCVLVGAFRRGSIVLLLLMMCVMLPLTLDLALTHKVADCGCFGDALVLTNWQSFAKNVVLLLLLLYLLLFNRRVHGLYGPAVNWVVGLLAVIYICAIAYNGYFTQPLIDFRPYKVGAKIGVPSTEAETSDEDYEFIYEKDGRQQAFDLDSLPDDDSGWEYVDRRFKPGKEPKARTQNAPVEIVYRGNDITDMVLPDTGRQLIIAFPRLQDVNISYTFDINEICDNAKRQGVSFFALTPADTAARAEWRDISMASYPIYNIDESELKTIVRGNPALVYVENGTVRWKRTLYSLDNTLIRNENYPIAKYDSDHDAAATLKHLTQALVVALLILLVFNRTHVLVRALVGHKKPQPDGDDSTGGDEPQDAAQAAAEQPAAGGDDAAAGDTANDKE